MLVFITDSGNNFSLGINTWMYSDTKSLPYNLNYVLKKKKSYESVHSQYGTV